jgi:hypothetical protein
VVCGVAGMGAALLDALGSLREIRGNVVIVGGGACLANVFANLAVIRCVKLGTLRVMASPAVSSWWSCTRCSFVAPCLNVVDAIWELCWGSSLLPQG